MNQHLYLGLDIGTSACKAALFTRAGKRVAMGHATYRVARAPDGTAEVGPEDWWSAAVGAVRQALAAAGPEPLRVQALGISGQIGNQVLLGADGRPVRPALIWQDTRAAAEAREIAGRWSREQLFHWLAIDLPVGPNWPAPRLLWLSRREPHSLERTTMLLQAKDYLLWRMTGQAVTDASSWRGLVNQSTGRPAAELLDHLGVTAGLLPRVQAPDSPAGELTAEAAEALGLLPGTSVATGWNDLNCALLGSGVTEPGGAFSVGGTSEHLGRVLERGLPPGLAPAGMMRAPYLGGPVLYGVTSAGGGSLAWYAGLWSGTDAVLAEAEGLPPGADGLLFLPYLNGERSPIWDPAARGLFFGLSSAHGRAAMGRAVLEGVAFSLRQVLERLEAEAGPVGAITVSGGPSASPLWNQIKASVWNRPLTVPAEPNAACLGAAILAACSAGEFAGPAEGARAMVQMTGQVEPRPDWTDRYDDWFRLYQSLYPALAPAFTHLSHLRDRR